MIDRVITSVHLPLRPQARADVCICCQSPPPPPPPQPTPPAHALLTAGDPIKNASAILRYALPINNKPIRTVQVGLWGLLDLRVCICLVCQGQGLARVHAGSLCEECGRQASQ